jgi:hypothetical protein
MKLPLCLFLTVFGIVMLIHENQGDDAPATDVSTSTDAATGSKLFPYFWCVGEDTGALIPCQTSMPTGFWCGYINQGSPSEQAVLCRTNNFEAELGMCEATFQRYVCVHKGFGWIDTAGKVRGCIGRCANSSTECSYAPNPLTCHDDFWTPGWNF